MANEIKNCTLREMVSAMSHLPDDSAFRWFQDSIVIPSKGWHQPTVTYLITMGQIRKELGLSCNTTRPDQNLESTSNVSALSGIPMTA